MIYNPTSGRELFQFNLSDLVVTLSELEYTVEVHPTKCAGDAKSAAQKACERKVDLIVTSGGDGTLSEVINGIGDYEDKPKIAYIPAGTTNDFARSVNIPFDMTKAIKLLRTGEFKKMDIGRLDDNYFVYSASFGAFTSLSYSTPSKLKTALGPFAYYINTVGELKNALHSFTVKVTTDREELIEDIVLLLIVNSSGVAGIRSLIKNVKLDDGVFNVIMLKRANILLFNEVIKNLISGVDGEFNKNGVIHLTASKIMIETEEDIIWNLDGERGTLNASVVECLPKHIEILLPHDNDMFLD